MRFYERIPRGNLGSVGSVQFPQPNKSVMEKEQACEHRLQVISETRIDCIRCGAEWKDMGL